MATYPVKIVEYVETTAILELPVPGFENLSLNDKLIAYHLWHASVAGDAITYDQNYKHALYLRDLFLDLIMYKKEIEKDAGKETHNKIETYTKKILLNHGIHDNSSTKKVAPTFSKDEFMSAYNAAKNAGFKTTLVDNFDKIIFDQNFEDMLTQKNPSAGKDILTASSVNYYPNLTMNDLKDFKDKNPNNSTVVKEQITNENKKMKKEIIVEKIWRAGNEKKKVNPGLYAKELKNICTHLNEAAKLAKDEKQKKHILLLKDYLELGTANLWDEFNIAWLHDDPEVDSILGFIEEYRDPRGAKGEFEGIVFFKNDEETKLIRTIANHTQNFENISPWNKEFKKTWTKIPVGNAITELASTGGAGPICWAGVNLPNSQAIREKHGSKSVIISNVSGASRAAFAKITASEFLETKDEQDKFFKTIFLRGPVMVTLHEIVGHGSGKVSTNLKGDPREYLREHYSALEEARAELCALHHIASPLIQKIGVIPDDDCWRIAYHTYALGDIVMLRMLENEEEIHEDHLRATHLIVQYLIQEKKCVELYKKNNKTYVRIIDYNKMKEGVAELLSELMRIKATGDYDAIAALINKYARHFDPLLRDEIVARSKAAKYPQGQAFVMPEPKLKLNKNKKVVDVELVYPKNILDQGRLWRKIGG